MSPSFILALVLIAVGCLIGIAAKHPVLGLIGGLAVAGALIWKLGEEE